MVIGIGVVETLLFLLLFFYCFMRILNDVRPACEASAKATKGEAVGEDHMCLCCAHFYAVE